MDCFNCKKLYNETDHAPRLLIQCGHSICEKCTFFLFKECSIQCPECGCYNYASSTATFPKNLALLLIKKNSLNISTQITGNGPMLTSLMKNNPSPRELSLDLSHPVGTQQQLSESLCERHGKKIEAFCEKEKLLLCITCILEDGHRHHEISSIANAAKKLQEILGKAFEACKILEEKILNNLEDTREAYSLLAESGDRSRIDVSRFFNEIRRVLNERESYLKQKLRDQQTREESNLKKQQDHYEEQLKKINELYEEYQTSQKEGEIELLEKCLRRQEKMIKATENIENVEFSLPFNEINPLSELSLLQKSLATIFPGQKIAPPQQANAQVITQSSNIQTPNMSVNMMANSSSNNKTRAKIANVQISTSMNKRSKNISSGKEISKQGTQGTNSKMNKKNENFQPVVTQPTYSVQGPASPIKLSVNLSGQGYFEKKLRGKNADMNLSENLITNSNCASPFNMQKKEQHNYSQMEKKHTSPLRVNSIPKNLVNYRELRDNIKEHQHGIHVTDQTEVNQTPQKTVLHSISTNSYVLQKNFDENQGPGTFTIDMQSEPTFKRTQNSVMVTSVDVLVNDKRNSENSSRRQERNMNILKDHYQADRKTPSRDKEKDLECSSIMSTIRVDKDESIKGDFKSFLNEGSACKFFSELTEVTHHPHRLDFSLLCQQMSNYIYVLGGFLENSCFVIEKYDILKKQWEDIDILPYNKSKLASVALNNGNILILGGKQEGMRLSAIEEYNIIEKRFKSAEISLTSAKSGFGAVSRNDEVMVVGGNDGLSILSSVEVYDIKSRRVKSLPSMNHRRDELAVTIGPDQKIYAIGGFGGPAGTCLTSAERFNPETEEWELIASMNVPRRALAAVTLPDGIYAIGGFDGQTYLSSVEKYDESTNEWIFVCSMNFSRCTLSAVASPDSQNIYVMGGFDNGPLNSVERYSILTDSWEIIEPMKHKRFMHSAVITAASDKRK